MTNGKFITPWMIIAAIIIAIVMTVLGILILSILLPPLNSIPIPTAVIAIIPAPTSTPTLNPDLFPTQTQEAQNESIDGIRVGIFVQITGTGNGGLRFRSSPGTANDTLFIASESEVFEVKEGPIAKDNFIWWYLAAPYDTSRSGWAVAQYLSPMSTTNP
jgi:hypothetical protein